LRDGIMRMHKAKMEQDIKKFEDHYVNFGKRVFERLQRDIFKVISSDNFKEWKPDMTKKQYIDSLNVSLEKIH